MPVGKRDLNNSNNHFYYNWRGISIEQLRFQHIDHIKYILGCDNVSSSLNYFRNKNGQIDLVLDWYDGIVNLFEIKYTDSPITIVEQYSNNLLNKVKEFILGTDCKKSIVLTLISFNSYKDNKYSEAFDLKLTSNDLFFDLKKLFWDFDCVYKPRLKVEMSTNKYLLESSSSNKQRNR